MSSVEAFLTRELDISFIDARNLVNEAKMKLDLIGYPTNEGKRKLREEAVRLFESRPEDMKTKLRSQRADFDTYKSFVIEKDGDRSSSSSDTERLSVASSTKSSIDSKRSHRKWLLMGGRRV